MPTHFTTTYTGRSLRNRRWQSQLHHQWRVCYPDYAAGIYAIYVVRKPHRHQLWSSVRSAICIGHYMCLASAVIVFWCKSDKNIVQHASTGRAIETLLIMRHKRGKCDSKHIRWQKIYNLFLSCGVQCGQVWIGFCGFPCGIVFYNACFNFQ